MINTNLKGVIDMSKLQNNDSVRKSTLHKINKDNIDAANREKIKKRKMRVARNRRLLAFFILVFVVIGLLGKTIHTQNERLSEKQQQKQQLEEQLTEVQDTQEMLKLQIAKLDDDDYIAKLARKEYFLSEQGEIIFTIPDEEDTTSKDKEDENKE